MVGSPRKEKKKKKSRKMEVILTRIPAKGGEGDSAERGRGMG